MGDERLVTEVPSSLKQLARLVVRGFYMIEDALIIDMLVRNPCMKEDDICELLKFERKMLRARIATLRSDKFIQVRLRMETGSDGKAQKVNYYFINYKTFVNVVKYKLDLMRKRMETEERDATSRASFKCPQCLKTFTDLEADQLFDFTTQEFHCTFCREVVEEDQSALPKKDSRLLLAKFNSQLEALYVLLREVEGIRLAPEVLEPDPVDISMIIGLDSKHTAIAGANRFPGEHWSGEATRGGGFAVEETRVDVTIGDDNLNQEDPTRLKERPLWMVESTVVNQDDLMQSDTLVGASMEAEKAASGMAGITAATPGGTTNTTNSKSNTNTSGEDIMSVLLAHERRSGTNTVTNAAASITGSSNPSSAGTNSVIAAVKTVLPDNESNSDSDEDIDGSSMFKNIIMRPSADVGTNQIDDLIDSDDEDDDEELTPTVMVGDRIIPIDKVTDNDIKEMTQQEEEAYIQVYQEYYSSVLD